MISTLTDGMTEYSMTVAHLLHHQLQIGLKGIKEIFLHMKLKMQSEFSKIDAQ